MDIGPRIKLVRARAQLSTRQLAERVGVSPTAISKFERGEAVPRQSTLLRLAKALSVGIEYFFREVKVETVAPAYRKHSALGKRVQEAIEATIVEAVERYLAAEELFPRDFFPESKLPRIRVKVIEDAENAAEELRQYWNLGYDPIENLCGRLENCGIKVVAVDGPKGFDGFSCWVNQKVPVIAFNLNVPLGTGSDSILLTSLGIWSWTPNHRLMWKRPLTGLLAPSWSRQRRFMRNWGGSGLT